MANQKDEMMMDFRLVTKEELAQLEEKRKHDMVKLSYIQETPSHHPIINELRFNHHFYQVGPLLVNKDMDKLECTVLDAFKLLSLHYIEVSEKGKGNGTKLLNIITDIADRDGYEIVLDIDETKGTPYAILERFYQSFGFVYTEGNEMIRKPK